MDSIKPFQLKWRCTAGCLDFDAQSHRRQPIQRIETPTQRETENECTRINFLSDKLNSISYQLNRIKVCLCELQYCTEDILVSIAHVGSTNENPS